MEGEHFLALDFGSGQITATLAVYDENTNTFRIRYSTRVQCPSVSACYILDFNRTVQTLGFLLEDIRQYTDNTPTVVVGLRGDFLSFRRAGGFLSITRDNHVIMERDVRAVLDSSIPPNLGDSLEVVDLLPQCFTLDGKTGIHNPIGLTARCLEAETFVSAGPKTHLQNINRVMEAVGYEDFEAVPTVLALCDTLLKPEEKQAGVLLLDIGEENSSAALYHKGMLEAAWETPTGAGLITREVADILQNDLKDAQKVLREYTYGDDEIMDEVLDESAEKLLRTLHKEWIQTLSFVKYPPSHLVLTGGGAGPAVKNAAKRVLGVRRTRTAIHDYLSADSIADLAPSFTSALSLALYSQRHGGHTRQSPVAQHSLQGFFNKMLAKIGLN